VAAVEVPLSVAVERSDSAHRRRLSRQLPHGDYLLGIRVVDRRGRRTSFLLALLRAVLCVLFPIGILYVAVSSANRSLQDLVVRTHVVYDWSRRD
jgi:uncharacterized RDD family membrane protein YckC